MYERNVLVQPGPLNVPPADRSFSKPSYRIIDFGRGLGLGINRSSLQDIKSEVETERSHARDQRLIPSGRKSRRCDIDLQDLIGGVHIFADVIRFFGRPPPSPPPPPAPTPSALHGATAAARFLEHIKKSKECGDVWLLDDEVLRMLRLFEQDEKAGKFYIIIAEGPSEEITRKWVHRKLDSMRTKGSPHL